MVDYMGERAQLTGDLTDRYVTMMGSGEDGLEMPERYPSLQGLGISSVYWASDTCMSSVCGPYRREGGVMAVEEAGEDTASLSYYHESLPDVPGEPRRRECVLFSGGPIAGTHWLRGAFGARRAIAHPDVVSVLTNRYPLTLHANLFCPDPIGTGYGRTLPWVPEDYFYGAVRDAEVAAAAIMDHIERRNVNRGDLSMVATSGGFFRAVGAALKLAEQGILVKGIACVSGHYDYALQDYLQTDDPRPFITCLPSLALVRDWHRTKGAHNPRELFEEYRQFAEKDYRSLLESPESISVSDRQAIIARLADALGMSEATLAACNYRVDPLLFAHELFRAEGDVLSLVDGRQRYPADRRIDHDPLIDVLGPEFAFELLQSEDVACNIFGDGRNPWPTDVTVQKYRGNVPAIQDWPFTGMWRRRRAHEAVVELLRVNPGIRFFHAGALYDPINPPQRATLFWQAMQEATGITVIQDDLPLEPLAAMSAPGASAHIRTYPAAHMIGNDRLAHSSLSVDIGMFVRAL